MQNSNGIKFNEPEWILARDLPFERELPLLREIPLERMCSVKFEKIASHIDSGEGSFQRRKVIAHRFFISYSQKNSQSNNIRE